MRAARRPTSRRRRSWIARAALLPGAHRCRPGGDPDRRRLSRCRNSLTSSCTCTRCGRDSSVNRSRPSAWRVRSSSDPSSHGPTPRSAVRSSRSGDMGKRIVWKFGDDLFFIIHLMIAGRFQWKPLGTKIPARLGLAAFDFPDGSLLLTEAGTTRRASLYVAASDEEVAEHDPGGLDVLTSSREAFQERLQIANHTLKRALTDPHLMDGIGNAYSDEILHAAQLSPLAAHQPPDRRASGAAVRRRAPDARRPGAPGSSKTPATRFRRRSRRFMKGWRRMAATASRARGAARRSSASATRPTRRTTVRPVRPVAGSSPIAACRG